MAPVAAVSSLSKESLKEAFGYSDEVADATIAIADAMGLDKTKIKVVKGGEASPEALFQQEMDGWRSRLSESVAAKGQTLPADQWANWMQSRAKEGAFSMEEAKWTGLSDWLASKGKEKVTPQQVREFLNENRVRVKVVEKGLKQGHSGRHWTQEDIDALEKAARRTQNWVEFEKAQEEYEAQELGTDDTKFSQYQLPGGTNYREVLVTLPSKPTDTSGWTVSEENSGWWAVRDGKVLVAEIPKSKARTAQEAIEVAANTESAAGIANRDRINERSQDSSIFISTHFPEPNILFHLRVNDRTDADGKRVLFIEEIQSDFGQSFRKQGEAIDRNFDAIVEAMKTDGTLKKRC